MNWRARLPEARRFDRNCVLASTAGQIIAASELGMVIEAIIVADTPYKVGKVAADIKLAAPQVDRLTATVAMAGVVGFCQAAGFTPDEIRAGYQEDRQRVVVNDAIGLLRPWIEDGRYARLVKALDTYQFSGTRPLADG